MPKFGEVALENLTGAVAFNFAKLLEEAKTKSQKPRNN